MLVLSDDAKAILTNTTKNPILIMEIDGWPTLSSGNVGKIARWDDPGLYFDMPNFYYDLPIADDTVKSLIDLAKSTNQITQQLQSDKGGSSSVTSFDVALTDKNQYVTEIITPGKLVADILAKKARLYLSFDGLAHPQDSVKFFTGIVSGVKPGPGTIKINLSSPEKLKNLEIFPKLSTELTAPVTSVDTTIPVASTETFLVPADSGTLRTYLTIEDEIIEYTGKTTTSFTGCVRGQFGTIASAYEINANAESAYRLIGNLRDLSLKLMLSGLNLPYVENQDILSIQIYGANNIPNAIFLSTFVFENYYGTVAGDLLTITDHSDPANNGTWIVEGVFETDTGSYITVNGPLNSSGMSGKFSIKSKYAVLPKNAGLEMTPDQVDIAEFELKFKQYSANFFTYDFFIKDGVKGSEFINTQILYPSGCYALPRKARTSIGTTTPPLAVAQTSKIDDTNVINAASIFLDRNISNNFYNAVVIKYDKDQVEDKYTRGKITQSSDSTNRIKVGNKPLTIESDGVRQESGFAFKFSIQSRRYLERYQFAAESLSIQTDYATGFAIEIGDVVILDGRNLQLSDVSAGNGTRNFQPRLFEVQNKVFNISGKPITLSLVDTAFSLNGRYGVVSPSSKIVASGSTTTRLKLADSFGTLLGNNSENFKWTNYASYPIRVHSKDYSFDEEVVLQGLDSSDDNALLLDTALSAAPLDGYIVDIPAYPASADPSINSIYKNIFVFFDNQIPIVSGISETQFTIASAFLPDIAVGYQVFIHSKDFTLKSQTRIVTNITGNTITVNDSLGFIPALDQKIELLGFPDNGKSYIVL